jgi:osmotically-inducible protein OsmY
MALLGAALALNACSSFGTLQKCGLTGCPGDAQVTSAVEGALSQHADIETWSIQVQTLDRVVYLYGTVDTDLEKNTIESLARETPGVTRVVNSISTRNLSNH